MESFKKIGLRLTACFGLFVFFIILGLYNPIPVYSQTDNEPNDDYSTASPLVVNGRNTGNLAATTDNVDWWSFTLDKDGEIKFVFIYDESLSFSVKLYDSDGATEVACPYSNCRSGSSPTIIGPFGFKAGTYYVKIDNRNPGNGVHYSGGYTLDTYLTAPSWDNDIEPNENSLKAKTLDISGITTGHLGYTGGGTGTDTQDWWSFTLDKDGEIKFVFIFDESLSFTVNLYDSDGATVVECPYSNCRSGTSPAIFGPFGFKAGTYYIKIAVGGGSYGGYHIDTGGSNTTTTTNPITTSSTTAVSTTTTTQSSTSTTSYISTTTTFHVTTTSINSTSSSSTTTSIKTNSFTVTKYILTKNYILNSCESPVPNYNFSTNDVCAYLYVEFENAKVTDVIKTVWYSMNYSENAELTGLGINGCLYGGIDIKGHPAENFPGNWYVDFYCNENKLFTANFAISIPKCPFEESLNNKKDIFTYRGLRTNFLANPYGLFLISLYYQNIAEVSSILKSNESLKDEFREILRKNIVTAEILTTSKEVIVSDTAIYEIITFLNHLKEESGLKLQGDIDLIIYSINKGFLLNGLGVSIE